MSTWADVRPDDRVSIRGDIYRVGRVTYPETPWSGKPLGVFALTAPDGTEKRGGMNLDVPVRILPAEEVTTAEEAVTAARVMLGAVEIGERVDGTKIWTCPAEMDDDTRAYHMKYFHHGETEHSDETAHIPHVHG